MGELEGKRARKGARKGAELVAKVDTNLETMVAFNMRAVSWWNDNILGSIDALEEPRNILVTTHGGFIVTLVKGLIGCKKARCGEGVVIWKCLNTSVSVLEVLEDRTAVVVQYGDVTHLQHYSDISCHEPNDPITSFTA
jgi:probable phosphoglycerate mutase